MCRVPEGQQMGETIHTVDPWGNGNDDSLSQVACGSDQDAFMLRQTRDGADQRGGYSSFLFFFDARWRGGRAAWGNEG